MSIQFDQSKRVLVVGEVIIDYHLDRDLLRLGGIFHSIRSLRALGISCAAAYVAPSSLDEKIEHFFRLLGVSSFSKVGDVTSAPGVILIADSSEAGNQEYREILRNDKIITWRRDGLREIIRSFSPTDVIIYPWDDCGAIIRDEFGPQDGTEIHLDVQYQTSMRDAITLGDLNNVTISISTSSPYFLADANSDPKKLTDRIWMLSPGIKCLILKENRGGSRVMFRSNLEEVHSPTFLMPTVHSVGVGDCFNAAWIVGDANNSTNRLRHASFIAALYATTFSYELFSEDVARITAANIDLLSLVGTRVPWEYRRSIHVYLAAPDFPNVDVRMLDGLERSLREHNFVPRRPVRENGLLSSHSTAAEVLQAVRADVALLETCSILIAVPLTRDPGTYAELGWFRARGKPVILFDPSDLTDNAFAAASADICCRTLAEVIDSVFKLVGDIYERER